MLTRGLQACKRKEKASGKSLKKVRFDVPSFVAPASAMDDPKVSPIVEALPTVEFGATTEVTGPRMP